MKKISILGTDKRSNYIRKLYLDEGKKLYEYKEADIVIAPIPFTRDGIKINGENIYVHEFIKEIEGKILFSGAYLGNIKEKLCNITYYDVMENESLAVSNAILTAEGAIFEAIKNSDKTLCGLNCLVLGYGRIGKILAKMLDGIGAKVFCEARKEKDLGYIKAMGYDKVDIKDLEKSLGKMDYIFNTIPVKILDEEKLKFVNKEALIIDLASNPGGVDFEVGKKLDLNILWALGLPSKYSPKTAAIYVKNTIDKLLEGKLDFK